ncbi:MAG: DegT/DnrJ/EryC1/StrS family aminotransferase [Candidatus Glassbacteria bacterium]
MNSVIGHSRPTIADDDIEAVARTLRSGWLSQGEEVRSLEAELARMVGMRGGVCVSSGTAALHLALVAVGVREGDRVAMPGYCCPSVLHAVRLAGGLPVLVDIDPLKLVIDADDLVKKVRGGVRALILVHLLGYPGPVEIRKDLGVDIAFIEDCAQSLGASVDSAPVGSFGDVGVFSFYATKLITTGEGGMVVSDDVELLSRVGEMRSARTGGNGISFNYTMSDVQAALGRSQLAKLNSFLEKRKRLAGLYRSELADCNLRFIEEIKGREPAHYRFVVGIEGKDLQDVITGMAKRRIECRRPFEEPVFMLLGENNLIGCRLAYSKLLSLPIYPSLGEGDLHRVAHELIRQIGGRGR